VPSWQLRSPDFRSAESGGGTPERRRLSFPRAHEPAGRPCKGKMPAEEPEGPGGTEDRPSLASASHAVGGGPVHIRAPAAPAGSGPTKMLRAEQAPLRGLTGGDVSSESARGGAGSASVVSTDSPGFLEGRKRKLEEALGDACKSLDSLDDLISRGKRRGGRGSDCCAYLSPEGCSRDCTRERRVVGAEAMEELLETIARAGDERLLREARSRTEAAAEASSHHAEGPSAAASYGAVSHGPSISDPRQHDAQAPGGEFDVLAPRLEPSAERFEITRWRRSLVRRVSSGGVAGSECEPGGDARDGGTSGAAGGVSLMWRVQVSGACSGLPFSLSFLVSQQADSLQLEGLEVDPCAAVEMAPLLQSVNAGRRAEGGAAGGGASAAPARSGGEMGSRGDGGSREEGGCLQDVIRSLSLYGEVARRRSDVLEQAAQRFRSTVRTTQAGGPLDFSSVRFCSHATGMSHPFRGGRFCKSMFG